jgi:hypothetical protein
MNGFMTLLKALLGSVCVSVLLCDKGCSKSVAWRLPAACFTRLLTLLLLLVLPAVVQAQFTYTTNDGAITITGYTGTGGVVTIPSTTNGLPVTGIGDWAFESCTNVVGLAAPNSITNMGTGAFWGCTSLTGATLGNSLTSIGDFAFADCFSLAGITIPTSITSIGFGAFDFCGSLTNVTIPSGVASIGGDAFYGCASLTSVFFKGNAPSASNATVFAEADNAVVYYLSGTTNWGVTFGGAPALLWNPQAEANPATFGVRTNRFGFNITGTTNIPIVVEASANLTSASWTTLLNCTLTNGSIYFSDPEWTNYRARSYRIRSP